MNNNKKFNKSEFKEKISFDLKYGILTPYYIQGEGENIHHLLMKESNNLTLISEKIRLLYVALTRAREQIIILNCQPKKESIELFKEDCVPITQRKKYSSFMGIYHSILSVLKDVTEIIEPDDLNISDAYLKPLKEDVSQWIPTSMKTIQHFTNHIEVEKEEKKHASKESYALRSKEEKEVMEYGSHIHELFETIDFSCVNLNQYNKNEQKMIQAFLNLPLLKDIQKGKVFKEFEFIDKDGNQQIHGIIDLMIVYEDHVDIIDYKLSHLEDEAYLLQLSTYQKYIQKKTNKPVFLWLYSILKQSLKRLDVIEKDEINVV